MPPCFNKASVDVGQDGCACHHVAPSEEQTQPHRHEAVVAERLQNVPRIHTSEQAALELKVEAICQATLGLDAGSNRTVLPTVRMWCDLISRFLYGSVA